MNKSCSIPRVILIIICIAILLLLFLAAEKWNRALIHDSFAYGQESGTSSKMYSTLISGNSFCQSQITGTLHLLALPHLSDHLRTVQQNIILFSEYSDCMRHINPHSLNNKVTSGTRELFFIAVHGAKCLPACLNLG